MNRVNPVYGMDVQADPAGRNPVAADVSIRLRKLAESSAGIKDRLSAMFGEGEAADREARPNPAGVFGEIEAALSDVEMFMARIETLVARIY